MDYMTKYILFIFGFLLVIFGITLVLREWACVVTVFKGVIGGALAVAGLVVMFAVSIKK